MATDKKSQTMDIELGVDTCKGNSTEASYLKNASPIFMNWMVSFRDRVKEGKTPLEEVLWERYSIYKVPAFARKLNPDIFTPQLVSFGPYHHGEGELVLMEVHKERALFHFLKRAKLELDEVLKELECEVESLMDSYELLDKKWKEDRYSFLKLMLTDGCFMLELLQFTTAKDRGYPSMDPFFSEHGIRHTKPYIRRDMLMIENQLPLLLLKKLVEVETKGTADDNKMHELLLRFVGRPTERLSLDSLSLHLLDLYRKSLLSKTLQLDSPDDKTRFIPSMTTIPNATSLREGGVTFFKSTSQSLKDIHFEEKKGALHLPHLIVDDATECTLLNIIVFEHLRTNLDHDVSSYVNFIDEVIDSATDVKLLSKAKILQNSLGSEKAVAALFNKICKEVTVDPDSELMNVRQQINEYRQRKFNTWLANLRHNYFNSPWSIIKVIAATLVIVLTIIQTGFSIKSVYNDDSNPPPSPSPSPTPPSRHH